MTSDVSFGSASVLAFGLPRFRPRCGFDGLGYYRRSITSFNELFDNTTRKRIAANPAVPRDVHADEIPIGSSGTSSVREEATAHDFTDTEEDAPGGRHCSS